jgi:Tetratricopeptide repeat
VTEWAQSTIHPEMPERQSLPPHDPERRSIPSIPLADSSRDAAQEDFLFHLYRGSELLQDNRVLEAKEELEHALTLQPRDTKGQDLLAAVYFRLGLYPRAISIYENLAQAHPRDASLKLNLALAYLKTGQPDAARGQLEEVVKAAPNHQRAWGYLGLAFERLGDLAKAEVAFERGGHALMAKRMTERRQRVVTPPPPPNETGGAAEAEVREVAGTAFEELDAGELNFALAEPGTTESRQADKWHAVELGKAPAPRIAMPARERGFHEALTVTPPPSDVARQLAQPQVRGSVPPSVPPEPISRAALDSRLVFPEDTDVALHATGAVLLRTGPARPFAVRLEAMRLAAGMLTATVLPRRSPSARDGAIKDTAEVLGGFTSPLARLEGRAELVLGARPGHQLVPLELDGDVAFVREELLLAFDLALAYENGRLALEEARPGGVTREGEGIVQLRGKGALVLELVAPRTPTPIEDVGFATLAATAAHPVMVRREWIVGWIGRLLPRPLGASEAPGAQRGLVAFAGEGTVLVAIR